jgi:hypothetical protein
MDDPLVSFVGSKFDDVFYAMTLILFIAFFVSIFECIEMETCVILYIGRNW